MAGTLRLATPSARRDLPVELLALREAQDFLGLEEVGGDNVGPMVEFFQMHGGIGPGEPWCAAMVNGVIHTACAKRNQRSPLESVELQGYVQAYVDWARNRGWILESSDEVFAGDLFCLFHQGKQRYAHIGLVFHPPTGGRYSTLEGNTGEEGEREGYKIASRVRDVTDGTLFIRWAHG